VNGKGWVAIGAALTGLTLCPLLGCGGRAVDGDRPSDDDDVLFEALPQRLSDCAALRAYTSARAQEMLALAPTGNPLEPLFEPGGSAGFEQAAYAEWPEATRQPGGGRVAYARNPGSSTDSFYLVASDAVPAISISPELVAGMTFAMPAGLKQARGSAAPAWIFADGERVLVVGALDGSAFSAAGAGTFFWQFDVDERQAALHQELRYVDARLIGARRFSGSVQVLLVANGSRLGLEGLPADQREDATRLAEVRAGNRAAIDAAAAGDWLPLSVTADASSGAPLPESAAPAIECSDIYAPATPSGLQLLTLVDLDLAQGLPSWQASGLYTGNLQVFAADEQWALVTEPWWSVSEAAAGLAARGSPETILHTFDTRARQLEPRGSIALRAAPQHDPAAANDGQHWLLATHSAYGPALNTGGRAGTDQGRVWSFQPEPGALALLGRSPTFPLTPETQTEFAPGVAYVHTPGSNDAASSLIDLADPSALELQDGPGADFRVLPWNDGQHVRVDLSQIVLLSGVQEITRFEQWSEPSLEGYALPEHGLLLDVPPDSPWHRTLRFHRLEKAPVPESMGTIRIRASSVLPPLIENGVLLNSYFTPRADLSQGGSMSLETYDAKTLSPGGAVGGSY
jgi:hypothetical protein